MRPETMCLVKSLKQNKGSTIWVVTKWLAEQNGGEQQFYNLEDVKLTLRETLIDYFNSCDDPRMEFRRLMHMYKCDLFLIDDVAIWATFLRECKVRDGNGNYINGFGEAIEYE